MKIVIILTILSILVHNSFALTCYGCEMQASTDSCLFTYECPRKTELCETLVSKVEGNYSLIFSCATMEKCGSGLEKTGLEDCKHSKPNTECYSCCSDSKCNDLSSALNKLPKEIFEPKNEEKFITKKDLNEEEKFLKDLEMLIEQDEKKLEDEGEWFNDKSEERNATTKNIVEILNETTSMPKVETNATTVNQSVIVNATTVEPANQTFTTTTQSLNIATSNSAENITISTIITSTDTNNSSIPLNSTTSTTKSLSSSSTESENKEEFLTPDYTDDNPEESSPSTQEEEENFSGEHHALIESSATFTKINAFLFLITFFVISIAL